ncbi:MAG TPA: tripartite tricarboxylate transporter substrate binding protein [Xanthobacteraceae bacterium]|nr:tripartite tricarboxylate transporter substrate binding protein [Xanthobacteraceae bacterium]
MLGSKLRRLVAALSLVVLALAAGASPAAADNWPTRPVRLILTLGPGSGADIGARLLADKLSQRWGQPVIVDNRTGGDGIVAINAFVSAHDDHVLLFSPTSSFTAHPFLHDHLPYKASDLVPITRVSNTFVAVSVPASLNVDSLAKFVALAREKPGQLNWAGLTGALDFLLAGWLQQENLNVAKIAYKNPVDAANDLAEGRVQFYESAFAIVRPQLQTGKIKVLAVTNTVRAPNLPDLPTVAEAGFPGLTVDGLVGLFGPTGISNALRDKITADIRAVADDTIRERLLTTGQLLNVGSADEFAKSLDQQRQQIADFAKKLGVDELPQN